MERITSKLRTLMNIHRHISGEFKFGSRKSADTKESMDWAIGLPVEAKDVVDSQDKPLYVVGDKLMTWDEMGEINQRRFRDSVVNKILGENKDA